VAFCNSCGASLPAGAAFCEKCGKPVNAGGGISAPQPSTVGTASPATPPQQRSALKIISIAGAVLLALAVLGIGTSVIVGMKIASRTHVRHEGDKVRVETPFGTVESNQDADEVAKNLGVEVYPGARAVKNTAATVAIGGMRTVSAQFQSDDSVGEVADFYKQKFPNANVTEGGRDHYTIVQSDTNGALTINIAPLGSGSQISIANVQKGSNSSK